MENKEKKVYLGNLKDREAELFIWSKMSFKKRIELVYNYAEEIKKIHKKLGIGKAIIKKSNN